jgi:hypothetical protein
MTDVRKDRYQGDGTVAAAEQLLRDLPNTDRS